MIVSTLFGGLGNQMFIYAMGRAMSLRADVPLAFNIKSGFKSDYLYKRELALDSFNLNISENDFLTFNFTAGRFARRISRIIGRNILSPSYIYGKEQLPYAFEKKWINSDLKNVYLEGYWQSEKYFADFEKEIRSDFKIKKTFDDEVYREFSDIKKAGSNAVMIGIRRYQESATAPGGVLDEGYYNMAIELIASKISNPVFFVFTQDQEWASKNLTSKYPLKMISPKAGNDRAVDDLYLMTACNHFIISNSSYYWWGAWLGEDKNKIVIAPDNFVNKDSVPTSWIKI